MVETKKPSTKKQRSESEARRLVAMHLQDIEGNPLDSEQVAMFEMFEREGWSQERRLAHIRERARKASDASAAK